MQEQIPASAGIASREVLQDRMIGFNFSQVTSDSISGMANVSLSPGLFSEQAMKGFNFSGYAEAIAPLLALILSMFIYSFFVFRFYRLLARRDILDLGLHRHSRNFRGILRNALHIMFYVIENILLIPFLVFAWFLVITVLLLMMTETHTAGTILLTSVSVVAVVRIAAYYNESLSQDLAKMIPFALLGVFLIDMSFFSVERAVEIAIAIPSMWIRLLYYLGFVAILEIIMRIISSIISIFRPSENTHDSE